MFTGQHTNPLTRGYLYVLPYILLRDAVAMVTNTEDVQFNAIQPNVSQAVVMNTSGEHINLICPYLRFLV